MKLELHNFDLVWVDWGTAFRDDHKIILNKVLREDYLVLKETLRHELSHDACSHYTFHDFLLDLQPASLRSEWFFIKHPSTWAALSPIIWYERQWCVDLVGLLKWLFIFFLGGVAWMLMR